MSSDEVWADASWDQAVDGFNRDLPPNADGYILSRHGNEVRFGSYTCSTDASSIFVPQLFESIQDQVMESVVGGAWPRCPRHGAHPVDPAERGWACPVPGHGASGGVERLWAYGSMSSQAAVAEPYRRDGEVRWFSATRGWGVIAHSEGDIFVHFGAIAGSGYRSLEEAQTVEFELDSGRQGLLRRARSVRVVA